MKSNCREIESKNKLEKVFYNDLSNHNFEIPIYQRPYAWKPEEVETLLNDLKESKEESYFLGTLVVNSLEKYGEKEKLEVIDGQQRLTTLYLISAVFRNKNKINLSYKIRESDKKFLEKLPEIIDELEDELENDKKGILDNGGLSEEFYKKLKEKDIKLNEISENILENLSDILRWKNENKNKINNPSELLEKVYFVLAYIPENTDVAKFFEVMNSRGKQLEQHQVLKARFLEIIKEDKKIDYAKIWDFCSNMDYYLEDLIYYSLDKKEKNADKDNTKIKVIRKNLIDFVKNGSLDNLKGEICNYFKLESENTNQQENNQAKSKEKNKTSNYEYGTLGWILEEYNDNPEKENERKYLPEAKEVNSIVKFSVFLLHTLRLFKLKELDNNDILKDFKDISLDDKKLLETFGNGDKNKLFFRKNIDNNNISNEEIKIAKKFILFLLKIRILFDYFIFKRSNILEGEDIKLRRLKKEGSSLGLGDIDKVLINLQLLFSFTSPNYFQQEWLTPTLNWLYKELKDNNKELENGFYEGFIEFLEKMDKYLSLERLNDSPDLRKIFDEFTKKENYEDKNANLSEKDIKEKLEQKLNNGTSTEHYWFYKLEYLLWKNFEKLNKEQEKEKHNNDESVWDAVISKNQLNIPWESKDNKEKSLKGIIENYRLTRKNSIEHIQPQSKADDGWVSEKKEKEINCREIKNKCYIDCFGNLALVSNHLNSSLLDKPFEEKRNIIVNQLNRGTIESLKMLLIYSKYDKWTPKECKEHHNEMLKILEENLVEKKH